MSAALFALILLLLPAMAATSVVSPSNLQGWQIGAPPPGDNAPAFSGFVDVPPAFAPPLGVGAYRVKLEAAGQKTILAHNKYNGTLLSDLTTFTYDYLLGSPFNLNPYYVNLYLNLDADATHELSLAMLIPNGTLAVWTTADTLAANYSVTTNDGFTYGGGPDPQTIADVIAAHPGARIGEAFGEVGSPGLRISLGDSAANYVGSDSLLDNIVIEAAGVSDVWDFEAQSLIVSVESGSYQSTEVNTVFSDALVASVTYHDGSPAADIPVTFWLPSAGASGTFTGSFSTLTVNTGVNGEAAAPQITANGVTGSYFAMAVINDPYVPPAFFQLTNTAAPAAETEILVNGSFEAVDAAQPGGIQAWKVKAGSTAARDCTVASDGVCSIRFDLAAGTKSVVKQKVAAPPVEVGDLVRFSAAIQSENAVSGSVTFMLALKYTDGTASKAALDVPSGTTAFTVDQKSLGVVNSVKAIVVKLKATGGSGKLWVDDASVIVVEDGLRDDAQGGVLPLPAAPDGWRQ